jgi:hypothetical protein
VTQTMDQMAGYEFIHVPPNSIYHPTFISFTEFRGS